MSPSPETATQGRLERFEAANGLIGYRSPLLARHGIPHLFTTRVAGPGRALDLGMSAGDATERIAAALGLSGAPLVTVRQVHGAGVLVLRGEKLPPKGAEADALISSRGDVLIGVHIADCVPILLARADGRRVAAVHAGWRGLVAGVIPRTLRLLGPGPILAAIGPCLSRAHFEVGSEVEQAFERARLAAVIESREGQRAHIDLRAAARLQLEADGVEQLDTTDRCTYEHAEEFYSYRRDVTHGGGDRTGRLGAFVAVAAVTEPGSSPPGSKGTSRGP